MMQTKENPSISVTDNNAPKSRGIYYHEPPSIGLVRELRETAKRTEKAPVLERDLPVQEFLSLFSPDETMRLVYVPHYITQCVIYYMDMMIEYAVSNRVSYFKRHMRRLREIKDDYLRQLYNEMPAEIYNRFVSQREEYLASCGSNLTLVYFAFRNQILKQFGEPKHDRVMVCANIIIALADYVAEFDNATNRRVAEILKTPCRNNRDARLDAVSSLCRNMVTPFVLKPNTDTQTCVQVMVNRAVEMVKKMK